MYYTSDMDNAIIPKNNLGDEKMIPNEEQLKRLFCGVVSWEKSENGLIPLRFTNEQMSILAQNERFAVRSKSSAGMRFSCETDAVRLEAELFLFPGSANDLYGFDLYTDGRLYGHKEGRLENGTEVALKFDLPAGHKKIDLYFPTLVGASIKSFALPNATYASPVRCKRLFCFGDSITQGYTVHFPSLCYTNTIARELGMELTDFAIGGDTFHPELLDPALTGQADLILIAYGTNDWSNKQLPDAVRDAEAFYERISTIADGVPVFSLMPIWRADSGKQVSSNISFDDWRGLLSSIAAKYPAIRVIPGESLFPQVAELFEDGKIHPNEIGSMIYTSRLLETIRKH